MYEWRAAERKMKGIRNGGRPSTRQLDRDKKKCDAMSKVLRIVRMRMKK